MHFVPAGDRRCVDWPALIQALRQGHQRPRAEVADSVLGPAPDHPVRGSLLSRCAWIDGLGFAVKSATIFPNNHDLPSVQSAITVFNPDNGQPEAILDGNWVTSIKTAADSVYGAGLLARRDSQHLLSIGAGSVAEFSIRAYLAMFPDIRRVSVWSRTRSRFEDLCQRLADLDLGCQWVGDLAATVAQADIICTSTMATQPVLMGRWVAPGTHVDLVGAFKLDMREADDELLKRGALYVDNRDTTLGHIGELAIPLARGVITHGSVLADLYDLGAPIRRAPDQITLFKNGGGAHLDLMVARHLMSR